MMGTRKRKPSCVNGVHPSEGQSESPNKSDRRLQKTLLLLGSVEATPELLSVFRAIVQRQPVVGATPPLPALSDLAGGTVRRGVAIDQLRSAYADVDDAKIIRGLAVAIAIIATVPTSPGQWKDALFAFVRRLKGVPGFGNIVADEFKDVVAAWYAHAGSKIGDVELMEVRVVFRSKWKNANTPLDLYSLDGVAGVVLAGLLPTPPEGPRIEAKRADYRRRMEQLLTLCWAMQVAEGNQTFFLDVRAAGKSLGFGKDAVHYGLRHFIDDLRVLEEVEKGWQGHASRYRYVSDARRAEFSSMLEGYHRQSAGPLVVT